MSDGLTDDERKRYERLKERLFADDERLTTDERTELYELRQRTGKDPLPWDTRFTADPRTDGGADVTDDDTDDTDDVTITADDLTPLGRGFYAGEGLIKRGVTVRDTRNGESGTIQAVYDGERTAKVDMGRTGTVTVHWPDEGGHYVIE